MNIMAILRILFYNKVYSCREQISWKFRTVVSWRYCRLQIYKDCNFSVSVRTNPAYPQEYIRTLKVIKGCHSFHKLQNFLSFVKLCKLLTLEQGFPQSMKRYKDTQILFNVLKVELGSQPLNHSIISIFWWNIIGIMPKNIYILKKYLYFEEIGSIHLLQLLL